MPEWPEARLLSFPGGWIAQDLPFGRSTAMRREIAATGHPGSDGHFVTIGGLAQDQPVAVLHPRRLKIAEVRHSWTGSWLIHFASPSVMRP